MLFDELFQYPICPACSAPAHLVPLWNAATGKLRSEVFPRCQIFNISNVAEYIYRDIGEHGLELSSDFPRPMPPFKLMWCEWSVPAQSRRHRGANLEPNWIRGLSDKLGCLVETQESDKENAAWIITMKPFIKPKSKKLVVILPAVSYYLNDNFEIMRSPGEEVFITDPRVADEEVEAWKEWHGPNENDDPALAVAAMMDIPLLAMSLLNCRNVVMVDVPTPEHRLREKKRRGLFAAKEHHIIEIQPMIKAVREHTKREGYSRAAVPIVRGHFKDYRERGLFGKYKGMFWWDQRIHTTERKEYRLKNAVGDLDRDWSPPSELRVIN